jgi:hypothetical protein
MYCSMFHHSTVVEWLQCRTRKRKLNIIWWFSHYNLNHTQLTNERHHPYPSLEVDKIELQISCSTSRIRRRVIKKTVKFGHRADLYISTLRNKKSLIWRKPATDGDRDGTMNVESTSSRGCMLQATTWSGKWKDQTLWSVLCSRENILLHNALRGEE